MERTSTIGQQLLTLSKTFSSERMSQKIVRGNFRFNEEWARGQKVSQETVGMTYRLNKSQNIVRRILGNEQIIFRMTESKIVRLYCWTFSIWWGCLFDFWPLPLASPPGLSWCFHDSFDSRQDKKFLAIHRFEFSLPFYRHWWKFWFANVIVC